MAAAALVVGTPASSVAQPSGIGRPFASAIRMRPMAVALIAMSTTSGRPSAEGNAIDKGLLPTKRWAPPGAGIKGRVFEKAKPTMPSAATWRVQNAAVPK